jgi:hypothetical protein
MYYTCKMIIAVALTAFTLASAQAQVDIGLGVLANKKTTRSRNIGGMLSRLFG